MKKNDATLGELRAILRQNVDERDWDQFHNPKDLALSLSLEAAEVLEHFQWKNAEEVAKYVKEKKVEIGEELSDVLAYVFLLADKLDIDLANAFRDKMEKSALKYPVEKAKGRHSKYTELADE